MLNKLEIRLQEIRVSHLCNWFYFQSWYRVVRKTEDVSNEVYEFTLGFFFCVSNGGVSPLKRFPDKLFEFIHYIMGMKTKHTQAQRKIVAW